MRIATNNERLGQSQPDRLRANRVSGSLRIGQPWGPIENENWASIDLNVSGISKELRQPTRVSDIVFARVGLLKQDLLFLPCPAAGPGLVCPADTEREIRATGRAYFVQWPVQQPLAVEPVVPVAKPFDPVLPRELGLLFPDFRDPQVVEAEIRRQLGLFMTAKERARFGDVRPFGKALTPPRVVLRYRMELWQIIGDHSDGGIGHRGFSAFGVGAGARQLKYRRLRDLAVAAQVSSHGRKKS